MSGANDGGLSFSDISGSRGGAANPNPMFDFLTGFAPRKLKDLFRWVEYLYYNSAHIFAALKKFAEYPVTEVDLDTNDEALRTNWDRVLNKSIDVKGVAIYSGLDLHLYGNSFISIYQPFNRFLICNECQGRTNVRKVKYKFKLKTLSFSYTCAACNQHTSGTLKDEKVTDEARINVIRWDPKLIDINHNAITGESVYYYTIPQELKRKVEKGDAHIVNTMPVEFLRAIRDNKVFEFAEGQIYHMKISPPAGIDSQWGFPPLTSTIKLFFYTAVLRKANEAIALEHIVPFRVLHPAAISGTADPATTINLLRWRQELESNLRKWRRDPNHIMFAPSALGVTTMGGQGRSLLTLGEVKDAEDNIIAAMGIPREFLYGGLSFTGSAITLRMLENQLETYTAQLNGQLEFIIEQTAKILSWKPVKAEFIPFKLIDDAQQKQLLLNLNSMKPLVSDGTILGMMDIDINDERKKRQQELLDETRAQLETQTKIQTIQNSLAQQAAAQAQAGSSGGMAYDPRAVLGKADELVQQLQGMDEGGQRSFMSQLSQEDPVMYAVVKDRLATAKSVEKSPAAQQQG
jgi:hypothetical protein